MDTVADLHTDRGRQLDAHVSVCAFVVPDTLARVTRERAHILTHMHALRTFERASRVYTVSRYGSRTGPPSILPRAESP